jgi:hypothetical protein
LVKALTKADGEIVDNVKDMETMAADFYKQLYTSEGVQGMDQVLQHVPRKVTPAMNAILLAPYEADEVKKALFQMFPLKAPGPDGYPAFFFQKHWDICGPDVTRAVLSIVQGNESAEIINDTILVIIPKLDMMKAYDRVEWEYLEAIMLKLGFSQQWTSVIMGMVNSVSFSVLFNGNKLEEFKPTRGIRQGDPISPYLFLLAAEGLSCLLKSNVQSSHLEGIKVAPLAPPVNHLLFADDSLLFFKGSREGAEALSSLLEVYCQASGQRITGRSHLSSSLKAAPKP